MNCWKAAIYVTGAEELFTWSFCIRLRHTALTSHNLCGLIPTSSSVDISLTHPKNLSLPHSGDLLLSNGSFPLPSTHFYLHSDPLWENEWTGCDILCPEIGSMAVPGKSLLPVKVCILRNKRKIWFCFQGTCGDAQKRAYLVLGELIWHRSCVWPGPIKIVC